MSQNYTTINVDYRVLKAFAKSDINKTYGNEYTYLLNIIYPNQSKNASFGRCHASSCKLCYKNQVSHYSCGLCKRVWLRSQQFVNHITHNKCPTINVSQFLQDWYKWYFKNNNAGKIVYEGINIKHYKNSEILKLKYIIFKCLQYSKTYIRLLVYREWQNYCLPYEIKLSTGSAICPKCNEVITDSFRHFIPHPLIHDQPMFIVNTEYTCKQCHSQYTCWDSQFSIKNKYKNPSEISAIRLGTNGHWYISHAMLNQILQMYKIHRNYAQISKHIRQRWAKYIYQQKKKILNITDQQYEQGMLFLYSTKKKFPK